MLATIRNRARLYCISLARRRQLLHLRQFVQHVNHHVLLVWLQVTQLHQLLQRVRMSCDDAKAENLHAKQQTREEGARLFRSSENIDSPPQTVRLRKKLQEPMTWEHYHLHAGASQPATVK